jgi:hypothetical protein
MENKYVLNDGDLCEIKPFFYKMFRNDDT